MTTRLTRLGFTVDTCRVNNPFSHVRRNIKHDNNDKSDNDWIKERLGGQLKARATRGGESIMPRIEVDSWRELESSTAL